MENKFDIEQFLDLTGYNKSRQYRQKSTQEFFTPYSIVKKMADKISTEDWGDTNQTN